MTGHSTVNHDAWSALAADLLPNDQPQALPARFDWTQFPGHGPDLDLLSPITGQRVVELGCGPGDHVALLTSHGAHATGVDICAAQTERARRRWGHLYEPACFVTADALGYLTTGTDPIDICYSVFGAIGLTPPHLILPAIRARLTNGGRLAFSAPHPAWPKLRRDDVITRDGRRLPVQRFLTDIVGWHTVLARFGFTVLASYEIIDPDQSGSSCLIFAAAAY